MQLDLSFVYQLSIMATTSQRGNHAVAILLFASVVVWMMSAGSVSAYDPDDKLIEAVLPKDGSFEAFYPRETHGIPNSAARAPHGHGSFFKHRNPALIDTKNAAAYGYRFDGKRRFNFD